MYTSINIWKIISIILFIFSLNILALKSNLEENSLPILSLEPSRLLIEKLNETQTFQLKIRNIENLNSWRVTLSWNTESVEYLKVEEGDFLRSKSQTTFFTEQGTTEGLREITCINLFPKTSVNGSGTLALVTYKIKKSPAQIDIEYSFLYSETDSQGMRPTIEHDIKGVKIKHINNSFTPKAIIDSDKTIVKINESIFLHGEKSNDPDGDSIIDYEWDLGDGTRINKSNVTHSYTNSGMYIVKLIVTDEYGVKSEPTTLNIEVQNINDNSNLSYFGIILALFLSIYLIRKVIK